MSAISDLVINDGEATPVAHTFEPAVVDGGYQMWEDRSTGIYQAFPKIRNWYQRPTGPAKDGGMTYVKSRFVMELPILREIVSGASTAAGFSPADEVHYRLSFEGRYVLPTLSSELDRNNLYMLVYNLLAHQLMVDQNVKLDPPF